MGAKPTLEKFLPPLETYVAYNLKILDIVQKIWPSQKTLHPSWCPKLVAGLGWERRSHTFLHYVETWLRSHRRDSDTQIRTARHKSASEQQDQWKFLWANSQFIQTI